MRCLVRSAFILSAATVAIASLSVPAFAQEQTIEQNFTITERPVSYSQSLTINRFDSSLGTLLSVSIQLNTSITANVSAFNPSTTATRNFTSLTGTIPVTVTGPASTNVTATATAGVSGNFSVAPRDTNEYNGLTSTSSNSQLITSGFGDYVGTGSQTAQLTVTAPASQTNGVGDPGLFYASDGSAGARVRVVYTYVVTPEPSALGFLAVGVGPIGAVIIRRRRRA